MRSEYEYARIELEELIDSLEEGVGSVRLADAARLAIKALRKQEPVNPTARFFPDGSIESVCQNCKEVVEEGEFIYCPGCGQAIDWSEE